MKKNPKLMAIIEKGEDGYYIGSVPALPGCHTQAKSLNVLERNLEEAIGLYLEAKKSLGQKVMPRSLARVKTFELACQ
ncbi:MAG: type II toxin-antitoxin system HicB family antitoxin [Candidatus Paceibacterota bacterium]|jgi:predicted RNase H-like HicB family nuclease